MREVGRFTGAHRRFRYEGELLARLSHPNIAQIHASGVAGTADDPRPWIAMEYVEGARDLLRYAGERGLDRAGRLALFRQVCDAVGYAHERGVDIERVVPARNSPGRLGKGLAVLIFYVQAAELVQVVGLGGRRTIQSSGTPIRSTVWSTSPRNASCRPHRRGYVRRPGLAMHPAQGPAGLGRYGLGRSAH